MSAADDAARRTLVDAGPGPSAASLERVLHEVAVMLEAAPGELDADSDLLAAGLDSIRAMILADRWGLGFLDLVTGPTPAAWALLLDAREA